MGYLARPDEVEANIILAEMEKRIAEEENDTCFEEYIKDLIKDVTPRKDDSFTPMQIMSQINEALSKESNSFGKVITIKGIFKIGNGKNYNGYFYDSLKDESNSLQLKTLVPYFMRSKIQPDSMVSLKGMIVKKPDQSHSFIEILFRVDSFVEEIRSHAISEDDLQRIALIQKKNEKGKKLVTAKLKNILMQNRRPKVLIIYAQTSLTDQDFDKGVKSAGSQIDFTTDKTVSFANTPQLISKLRISDSLCFDAICLVRGGGGGMEKLDNVSLFECLLNMNTPVIGGLGHVGETYSIKSMVDEDMGTPSLLGQYFDNLVKETAMEREGTINNLAQKMEAKYKPHMDRLAELEKASRADKTKIDSLLKEKRSDADSYTRLNKQFVDLQASVDNRIRSAEKRIHNKLTGWKILSFILFVLLFACAIYIYGQTQSWW